MTVVVEKRMTAVVEKRMTAVVEKRMTAEPSVLWGEGGGVSPTPPS